MERLPGQLMHSIEEGGENIRYTVSRRDHRASQHSFSMSARVLSGKKTDRTSSGEI